MKRDSDPVDDPSQAKRSCLGPSSFSVANSVQQLVELAGCTLNNWSPDVSLDRLRHSCTVSKCLETVLSHNACTELLAAASALEATLMCRRQLQTMRIGMHAQMALHVSHSSAVAAFSEDLAHFMALCLCESVLQLGGFECPASNWWQNAPGLGTPAGWLIPPGMRVKSMTAEQLDTTMIALLQYFGSPHWIEKGSEVAGRVALLGVALHWRASELLVGHMYTKGATVPSFLQRRLHWANTTCLLLVEVARWTPWTAAPSRQPAAAAASCRTAAPAPIPPAGRGSVFNMAISPDESTLYATDSRAHYILQIAIRTGSCKILSGGHQAGFVDGVGCNSRFNSPCGLAISPDGTTLFVADSGNNSIRFIKIVDGTVHTLVGSPAMGCVDGCGPQARLNIPASIALSPDGSVLFVADAIQRCIRQVLIRAAMVSTLGDSCKFKVGHVNLPAQESQPDLQPHSLDLILCLSLSSDGKTIVARGGPNTHIRRLLLGQSRQPEHDGFVLKRMNHN